MTYARLGTHSTFVKGWIPDWNFVESTAATSIETMRGHTLIASCLLLSVVLDAASAFQSINPSTTRPYVVPPRARPLEVMRSDLMYTDVYSVPLLLITAVGVGIAAQSFINQMLEGEDGLGAFLSDGSGYNKSGFESDNGKDAKKDPLPWLKLPELDFVEVAGQEKFRSEADVLGKPWHLRQDMNQAVEGGNMKEAEALQAELEQIMKTCDIECARSDRTSVDGGCVAG